MKSKKEVIAFAKYELEMNNTLVTATVGNGGSGIDLMQTQDEDAIDTFEKELNGYCFDGLAEDAKEIKDSEYYDACGEIYQFSDNNGYRVHILTF